MNTCLYCGNIHSVLCPLIKAIEYFPNGTVKRVEFKVPIDYQPLPTVSIPSVFYPSFDLPSGTQYSTGYLLPEVPSNNH